MERFSKLPKKIFFDTSYSIIQKDQTAARFSSNKLSQIFTIFEYSDLQSEWLEALMQLQFRKSRGMV
jgi:hypothetical protein